MKFTFSANIELLFFVVICNIFPRSLCALVDATAVLNIERTSLNVQNAIFTLQNSKWEVTQRFIFFRVSQKKHLTKNIGFNVCMTEPHTE